MIPLWIKLYIESKRGKSVNYEILLIPIGISVSIFIATHLYTRYVEAKEIYRLNLVKKNTVIETSSAGKVLSTEHLSTKSLFWSNSASIQTDKAVYLVDGAQTIKIGVPLDLQRRQSGVEYLCEVNSTSECYLIISK